MVIDDYIRMQYSVLIINQKTSQQQKGGEPTTKKEKTRDQSQDKGNLTRSALKNPNIGFVALIIKRVIENFPRDKVNGRPINFYWPQ